MPSPWPLLVEAIARSMRAQVKHAQLDAHGLSADELLARGLIDRLSIEDTWTPSGCTENCLPVLDLVSRLRGPYLLGHPVLEHGADPVGRVMDGVTLGHQPSRWQRPGRLPVPQAAPWTPERARSPRRPTRSWTRRVACPTVL